jgi:hypothetical protein
LTIDFLDFPAVRSQPGIAQQFALRSGGQDLSAAAKHGRIFYQADFLKIASAPGRGLTTQRKQLTDVGQKEVWRL